MNSWTSILRPLSLGLVTLGVAGVAIAQSKLGTATSDPACCQLTTSLIQDALRGKDVAGDERFFSADGAPANIHFLIDTSGSMRELPQISNGDHEQFFEDTTNGCVNARLNSFLTSRGWDPNVVYPVPDPGTGLGSDTGFFNLFLDDKYYAYMAWGDSSSPAYRWLTKEQACQMQVPYWDSTRSADYDKCLSCLSTKGYYKLPEAEGSNSGDLSNPDFILWGRLLNFNPPKYVTAKAVLKQVIKDLRRVRAGFSIFTNSGANTQLRQRQNPSCDQILSNSSSFDSNRAAYINDVNSLNFSTNTPLARSLLNVGYYFTSDEGVYRDVFGFGTGYSYPLTFRNDTLSSQNRSVCWGCQTSSIIIITDGEPTSDSLHPTVITKLRQLNDGPVYCPDSAWCGTSMYGSGRDKGSNASSYTDDNANYYLDDVAKLLANQDLQRNSPPVAPEFNTAGVQSLSVYTVGFGINSNLLKNTALVGNGEYYTAEDSAGLKQALLEIITSVQTRATSFSSAGASALQVRAAGDAVIPRFEPSRNRTSPWKGFLYRFKLAPERLLDCTPSSTGDLNNDGDCNDTLLIDAEDAAVVENDEGKFVKLLAPTVPAVPFWEAGAKLVETTNHPLPRWRYRNIYTVVDRTGDGKLTRADAPIPFREDYAAQLADYLGISDNPNACADIATRLGVASLSRLDCARVIIRWYRGADALNPDPARRGMDREFMLHDIFHSSPTTVEPPSPKIFCDFSNQCTYTLFSGNTPDGSENGPPAYDLYQQAKGGRDKIVLVGSNGGMLHAFHNGVATGMDPLTKMREYNEGTGEELWAFVPPDLLPKLRPNLGKHAYLADGTPMVREVWLDGVGAAANGIKEPEEYRTVAVVGTGRGGVHRFALDLTRLLGTNMTTPSSVIVPNSVGDFLWMWPQPCDPLALKLGESFSNFAPRPPPIGPVALSPEADDAVRAANGLPAVQGNAPVWMVENDPARERWVVAFNGGYDQTYTRGRGFAIVDLTSGHTLWSYFHGDDATRSTHLRYPIGAGISLLDIGRGTEVARDSDLLLDSATVGDYGGQLWMLRMWKPGQWDTSTQRINNWFAARAFRVEKPGTSNSEETVRGPFSYMTTNTHQPDTGYLRTFVGTGDRENLLDKGSVCRLSNPHACASQGCEVTTSVKVERGGSEVWNSTASFQDYYHASVTSSTGSGGTTCSAAKATLTWDINPDNSCGADNSGSIEYTCDGTSSTWSCRETANTWTTINFNDDNSPYPRRFYGVWTYGGNVPTRMFDDEASADAYDDAHFTDTDLIDVSGSVQSEAPATGKGWYINYAQGDERTGNNGSLVSGCMLWASFEPSSNSGAVCSTTGTNISRLYQANYATGRANCALSFYAQNTNSWSRYIEFNSLSTAPELTTQLTVGGGQLTRGALGLGPGLGGPGGGGGGDGDTGVRNFDITTTDEGVKSLYQIVLDRKGHDCRHEGKNCE